MSIPLPFNDPCKWMLDDDDFTSHPTIYKKGCYICDDPEFAQQMGLPLCYSCKFCGGHVTADNVVCDECGKEQDVPT
jgi:hypothetical protein